MDSFWRRTVVDGQPQVLGLYHVGDSCVRSNPKFGRGCTWSAVAERLSMRFSALVTEATASEPEFFRELWTGYHGLQGMSEWTRKPLVWPRLARAWLNAGRYRQQGVLKRGRPGRGEMAGIALN